MGRLKIKPAKPTQTPEAERALADDIKKRLAELTVLLNQADKWGIDVDFNIRKAEPRGNFVLTHNLRKRM